MKNYLAVLTVLISIVTVYSAPPAPAQSSPTEVFETVHELLDQNNPDRAVKQAEETISQMQDSQKAFQTRVRVARLVLDHYLQEGSGKAALERELDTLLENAESQSRELAYLLTGRIHVFIHEYKQAQELLSEYLQNFPRPSKDELKEFAGEDESIAKAARRHPRIHRRRVAGEMLERLKMVGQNVPTFQLATLSGETLTTEDLKGNPAILLFWRASSDASTGWMKLLRRVYSQYREKGLQVVGLSVDSDKQKLTNFLEQNNLPWEQVFLGGRRKQICRRFGVQALYPASFLVDSEGVVRGVDLKGTVLARELDRVLAMDTGDGQRKGSAL